MNRLGPGQENGTRGMSSTRPYCGKITKKVLETELSVLRKKTAGLRRELVKHRYAEDFFRRRGQLLSGALSERQRMARDFLDALLQSLFAAGLALEAGKYLLETDPRRATVELRQATGQLDQIMRHVREFLTGGPIASHASPSRLHRPTR